MPEHHHVIIVGAGPAGAAAAFFLAHEGVRDVLVLDRMLGSEVYDRYHSVCGEGISSRAFRDLAPMQPWHLRDRIKRTELVWPGGVRIRRRMDGLILDRPLFLQELRRRAAEGGCTMRSGTVVSIREDDQGFIVRLRDGAELSCRYLLGADGAFSCVRRDVFGSRPRRMIAVQQCLSTEPAREGTAEIEMGERFQGGYRWVFPSQELSNVGFPKGEGEFQGVVSKGGRYLPFGGVEEMVRGRAMLIGDAAAQANPVCFGGLRAAMTAAKVASRAVAREDPQAYARWWKKSLWSSHRFLLAHDRLRSWSDAEMERAVRPFRRSVNPLSVLRAVVTMPGNVPMYIAYLITFRYAW